MVLRTLLLLLLATSAFSVPKFLYLTYTGNGNDFERVVDTDTGQEITAIFATPLVTGLGYDDPGLIYFWGKAFDTLSISHSIGADKDSCSFGFTVGGVIPGNHYNLTTKGIKRVSGDSVIVGKWLNQQDTTYAMWVISDPAGDAITQGFYLGSGANPQTVGASVTDSLYGLIVIPQQSSVNTNNTAFWSYGTAGTQYLGERGADLSNVVNDSFDVTPNMQTSNWWYCYFGVVKGDYVETFSYVGNATNPRTLNYSRAGNMGFIIFGSAIIGGSAVTSVFASSAGELDGTSWTLSSVTSADWQESSGDVFTSIDSLSIGGNLNVNTLATKIFVLADTIFYSPSATPTSSVRQPCEGDATIKSNYKQDRYK